jgi:hypothetical protein
VEVVPKVGDAVTVYQPSKSSIEAVKEAMVAIRGDVWIYIIACVIGEEGVSGVIGNCVSGSRYRVGVLGGL